MLSRVLAVIAASVLITGCAGFRGGWESVAYVGEAPPPGLAESIAKSEPRRPPELALNGLKLRVSINNRLRTYDTQVYLFALPLSIDPRAVYSSVQEPGKTRVMMQVTPEVAGYVFTPEAAVLQFGGKRYTGIAAFEFGRWDEQGNRVERGGTWGHRPIQSVFPLLGVGRRYILSIDFQAPTPSPESRDISLDLSQALRSRGTPPLPLIRFTPIEWSEGYT